jgi:uroporphyrinogen-III synthase
MKTSQVRRPRVVVARSKEGNEELKAKLLELDIEPLAVDTIEFLPPDDWAPVDRALRRLGRFDWVAFTSPRAVDLFVDRLSSLGIQEELAEPKFAAVGASTAAHLQRAGRRAEFVPGEYLTSALGEGLPRGRGKRVLLLRTDIAGREIVTRLRRRGFQVTDLVVYRTRSVRNGFDSLDLEGADLLVFASPSEVRGFVDRIDQKAFDKIREKGTAACIGPVTARAAVQAGFKAVITPREHTVEALVEEVRRFTARA